MDLELSRSDLIQVGPVSSRGTIRVLPFGKHKRQRVVVGDDTASVVCFEIKKNDTKTLFKTIPGPGDVKVSALTLGGTMGHKDKIFVAAGLKVRGLTKKGREFFTYITNLTETITGLFVEDTKLWTVSQYMYNMFNQAKDVHNFMCSDTLHSMAVVPFTRDTGYDAVLGCQDRLIRVISGSDMLFSASVPGPVTVVTQPLPPAGSSAAAAAAAAGQRRRSDDVIYGTETGVLGQLSLMPSKDGLARGWTLDRSGGKACINCVTSHDLTQDEVQELIVGRDDGTVEVYSLPHNGGGMGGEPHLLFSRSLGESVRGMECGVVSTVGYQEVLCTSFSGRITSFTTEPLNAADEGDQYRRSRGTVQRETKVVRLRKELEKLQEKLAAQQERLTKRSESYIPVRQQFSVSQRFRLAPAQAAYTLTLELPIPLDCVALTSSVEVDLLDVSGEGSAIVSRTPVVPGPGAPALLATYRCQEPTNRLEITLRTVEGRYGDIDACVVGRMSPPTAQSVKLLVKPLSLHARVRKLPADGRPMNRITFSGSFSLQRAHEWVVFCLPDAPAHPEVTGDGDGDDGAAAAAAGGFGESKAGGGGGGSSGDSPPLRPGESRLFFRNTYVGSVLECRYSAGEAQFRSDNLSTIAILKEVISKSATESNLRLSMSSDIRDDSVAHMMALLHPKLSYQLSLAKKMDLMEGLNEVKLAGDAAGAASGVGAVAGSGGGGGVPGDAGGNAMWYLAEEYRQVLTNSAQFKKEFAARPQALHSLHGLVTDLYVDRFSFKGQSVKHNLAAFSQLLEGPEYSKDATVAFILGGPQASRAVIQREAAEAAGVGLAGVM